MKKIEKKDLKELFEHIGAVYIGDYAAISRDLNRAVYYLHYLEKDVIRPHDAQDTCYALHQLAECLIGPSVKEGSANVTSIERS